MEAWRLHPWRCSRQGWTRPWAGSHNLSFAPLQLRARSVWENSKHWGCRTRQETHADLNSLKNHLYCTVTAPRECVITDAAIEDQKALSCQNSGSEKIQLPWILIRGTAFPNLVTKEKLESLIPTFTLLAKGTSIRKNNLKWESYRTLSERIFAQVLLCFSSSLDSLTTT